MNSLYFGIDVGRSDVKCQYGPDVKDVLVFPSFVSGEKTRFLKSDNLMENLEVTIDGRNYFVGELAREKDGSREFGSDKIKHQNTMILLLTAIAAAPTVPDSGAIYPRICVGLPLNNYGTQANEFENQLSGVYHVTIPGKSLAVHLGPDRSLAMQEGVGALMDMSHDEQGRRLKNNLLAGTIGLGDIGFKTVHIIKMVDGAYKDSYSGTLERLGVSNAFLNFYKRVSQQRGLKPNEAELEFKQNKNNTPELKSLASEIEGALSMWWPDTTEFNQFYWVGGGAGVSNFFEKYQGVIVPNSQTANARGFRKVAVAKLK
jgi:plasmid segregation protein ParM